MGTFKATAKGEWKGLSDHPPTRWTIVQKYEDIFILEYAHKSIQNEKSNTV